MFDTAHTTTLLGLSMMFGFFSKARRGNSQPDAPARVPHPLAPRLVAIGAAGVDARADGTGPLPVWPDAASLSTPRSGWKIPDDEGQSGTGETAAVVPSWSPPLPALANVWNPPPLAGSHSDVLKAASAPDALAIKPLLEPIPREDETPISAGPTDGAAQADLVVEERRPDEAGPIASVASDNGAAEPIPVSASIPSGPRTASSGRPWSFAEPLAQAEQIQLVEPVDAPAVGIVDQPVNTPLGDEDQPKVAPISASDGRGASNTSSDESVAGDRHVPATISWLRPADELPSHAEVTAALAATPEYQAAAGWVKAISDNILNVAERRRLVVDLVLLDNDAFIDALVEAFRTDHDVRPSLFAGLEYYAPKNLSELYRVMLREGDAPDVYLAIDRLLAVGDRDAIMPVFKDVDVDGCGHYAAMQLHAAGVDIAGFLSSHGLAPEVIEMYLEAGEDAA